LRPVAPAASYPRTAGKANLGEEIGMRGSEFAQLKALAMIVEMGSFSRAAAQLRLSRSALSETIRNLEQQLDVVLLNRTTRSVSPTEAGARLLARFIPAMADMESALQDVRSFASAPAGTLRVHAQRLAYEQFLRPSFHSFFSTYPDINLDVTIDDAVVDIVAGGFDAGLRLGELLEGDMVAVRLGADLKQIAAASPAYLAAHGMPQQPKDLLSHHCIGFRWPGQDAIYNWEFNKDGTWFAVAIKGPLVINDQRAALRAAVDGVGIAFWVESEIRPLIAAGKLVPLLEDWAAPFPGFYLYFPRHQQRSAPLRAFIAFLSGRTSQAEGQPRVED